MTLVPVDASNEASVITLLEKAAQWLAEAVHRGEPGEVAMVKAQLATAAEATKQLNLSKDIQLDAQEMVRRAEYALARAIRRGQEEGVIRKHGEQARFYDRHSGVYQEVTNPKVSPTDFATKHELAGTQGQDGIYVFADNATPEQFDEALADAKAEGNLSRANVVRKVKRQANPVITRAMRAEVIADLAERGYTSHQMVDKVSVSAETIRGIAREFDIDIPADKVMAKKHLMNHTESVDRFVTKVENTVSAFQYVDLAEVDFSQADEWVASLTASISALNRIKKHIAKEATQ